jgi:hypothetical protein
MVKPVQNPTTYNLLSVQSTVNSRPLNAILSQATIDQNKKSTPLSVTKTPLASTSGRTRNLSDAARGTFVDIVV